MSSATQEVGLKAENILLFGATGLIGKFILESILNNRSHFSRIAVFTSPSTLDKKKDTIESIKGNGVEVIVGDVRNEKDVLNAYNGEIP